VASLRARIIRSITSRYIKRIDVRKADVNRMRRRLDTLGRLAKTARGVRIEEAKFCGFRSEWLRPKTARPGKLLLYLHGGAYVLGSCRSHRHMVSHIARAAGINALLPEYRLAPEHRFPAAIDDVVTIYRKLLDDGHVPENIIVAGDSAGGGLAVAAMLSLRHAGLPLPAANVLLSPFLDATASGESTESRADRDPWFHAADVGVVVDYYCGQDEVRNPLVSPVFANVAGLPPAYIQVGDDEILLSDSTRYADMLRAAGIGADIEVWPEMWHVWQLFVGKMPESRKAIDGIGKFIRKTLG